MKSWSRWLLVGVLFVNAVVATFLIGGVTAHAESTPVEPAESAAQPSSDAEAGPSREALRLLGEELAERAERLAQREQEFEEWLRGSEVHERAGLIAEDETAPEPTPVAAPAIVAEPQPQPEETVDPAFERLRKAYENMEPDSAALALKELAAMDRDAVVELIVAWPPRTSGAILDALTQIEPALAARLSYEIWKRDGKGTPPTADSGR